MGVKLPGESARWSDSSAYRLRSRRLLIAGLRVSGDGCCTCGRPQRGTRCPVTDYPDFSHLEQADQVAAAISGGGWHAYWKDEGPTTGR
jgi:hypothetical protein